MALHFEQLQPSYLALWNAMTPRPDWSDRIDAAARGIIRDKNAYREVEDRVGVPWFVVGLIHQLESSRSFDTHLHNGDPLSARTANVPAGRPVDGAPPFLWTESAADALCFSQLDQVEPWTCERIAFQLEKYNGFRSRTEHGINTPYLWSGTTHYDKGKFVRDNVWDADARSQQAGAMPILQRLMQLDPTIGPSLGGSAPATAPVLQGGPAIDIRELQTRLSKMPMYRDDVDGLYGPHTRDAIRALLASFQISGRPWTGERLVIAGLQALCRTDGIDAGDIDGILGPQTKYALEVYQARKRGDTAVETWRDRENVTPPAATAPARTAPGRTSGTPRQSEVDRFYGEKGENQVKLMFPYPMRLAWDTGTIVRSTSCHEKVHDATSRILTRVLDHYGPEQIREFGLDLFGGCLNVRKMRGGTAWSMHSWGIAFDFDPERNQLSWGKDKAVFARPAYQKWFELWEEEGATSLGRARNYDWMHTQFAAI